MELSKETNQQTKSFENLTKTNKTKKGDKYEIQNNRQRTKTKQ